MLALPPPRRPVIAQIDVNPESQEEFDQFGWDMNDPDFFAAFGDAPVLTEADQLDNKTAEVGGKLPIICIYLTSLGR